MARTERTLAERWLHFWFAKCDPTTLGFIRIVTGLLVVYTHLAYSFDLTGFFGEHAWYDRTSIDIERREVPQLSLPLTGWDDRIVSGRVPEAPHLRKAFLEWMRKVAADPATRDRRLKLLDDLHATGSQDVARAVLGFVKQLRSEPAERAEQIRAMKDGKPRSPLDASAIPAYLKSLPATGANSRDSYAAAIEQFVDALPADPDQRTYVINHLFELDFANRGSLIAFLKSLPDDPDAREREIRYLAYWNVERSKTLRQGHNIFSMWFHISDPATMTAVHVACLAVLVLFTIGLWTRMTSILTWLITVSYIHRTQYVLFGMDTMSNILLIYLMIGNSGAALSLDRLIARYRVARRSIARSGTLDEPTRQFLVKPPASVSAGLGLRLLQIHFCFIYMAAGLSKLKGGTWWSHDAYWLTVANPEFTMIQFSWYEAFMRFSVEYRIVYAIFAAIAVVHTFIAEIGLPFLVWTRLRPVMVVIGVMLHAGIAIFMGLNVFSLLMMIMLLGYLPGAAIRNRLFGKAESTLLLKFDPANATQSAGVARAVALDTDGGIDLKPTAGQHEVVASNGRESWTGAAAANQIAKSSSLVGWMTWIPGMSGLMARWLTPGTRG